MSRSSLRMKQYRPSSADIGSKSNSFSAVFGLGGGGSGNVATQSVIADKPVNSANNGGVMLINYKQTDCETEQFSSLTTNGSNGRVPSPIEEVQPVGLAPIAQDEDLDSNFNETFEEDTFEATPAKQPTKTATKESPSRNPDCQSAGGKSRRASLPHQILLDSAKLLLRDRSSSGSILNNRKLNPRHAHSTGEDDEDEEDDLDDDDVEDDDDDEEYWGSDLEEQLMIEEKQENGCFTDSEEVEKSAADKVAPDKGSNNKSKPVMMSKRDREDSFVGTPQDESKLSNFIKTKSLREKFRDSKNWAIRKSVEKEITSTALNESGNSSQTSMMSPNGTESTSSPSEGRLSRLFSLRRSIGSGSNLLEGLSSSPVPSPGSPSYTPSSSTSTPNASSKASTMPRLAEEEEMLFGTSSPLKKAASLPPPTLPPLTPEKMASLTPAQMKRRHIISSLVHSENSYVATLQRLVNDYKRPLEESNPPILSKSKVEILFHRVPELLQCHLLFRIALTEAAKNWDQDEKIGDVFVASFSKAVVLEIYSDFINNFSVAMECAKSESKRKSALADFLKVKQITAHDRVSFFGLMVKPVQRFPQFILLLQDLLKDTPQGHPDRMALQLALTTLESLAEMLNERKRESEQYAAFKEKMRNFSGKLSTKSIPDSGSGNRFLLKEDDVVQLEFNTGGHITRSKPRRLLLLNDFLLCVSVNGRSSDVDFNSGANERLSLKWAVPVHDVELVDGAAGGTLARLLAPSTSNPSSLSSMGKRASLGRNSNPMSFADSQSGFGSLNSNSSSSSSGPLGFPNPQSQAESLAQDMADLMHDFDVVSRIASLINTMKSSYEGLTTELTSHILSEIQKSIRQKDEEMSFMDACCLQFSIKTGNKAKDKAEILTFQTRDPSIKKDWVIELRLAQLALDPSNSPGWDVLENERSVSTKMPLFVKSSQVCHENYQTEISCGCSYSLMVPTPTRTLRKQTYVWINATKCGSNSSSSETQAVLRVFSVTSNQTGLKELGSVDVPSSQVKSLEFVPGINNNPIGSNPNNSEEALKSSLIWVGTDNQKILIYSASDPERGREVARLSIGGNVTSMNYHCDAVFIGLSNGSLFVYKRDLQGVWDLNNPQTVLLGKDPVSSLLPVTNALYAACGRKVWLVDPITNDLLKSFIVHARSESQNSSSSLTSSTSSLTTVTNSGYVQHMAQSGVGLWISLKNSPIICLYHTETFRHLQDINIASNVTRVLAARDVSQPARSIHVTALMASKGLLWVGTNVGIALTIPLPRLEGVPIISGRANISYHAHFGPVSFFLNLQPKVIEPNASNEPVSLTHQSSQSTIVASATTSSIKEEPEHELKTSDSCNSCVHVASSIPESCKMGLKKQHSDSSVSQHDTVSPLVSSGQTEQPKLRHRNSSPCMNARRRSRPDSVASNGSGSGALRRTSKTLPRGFSLSGHGNSEMSSMDCDVFGLYEQLLNVRDYDCDSGDIARQSDDLRRSDPELSTIPYRVSTLDRRVQMKTSRPRSLDMSSWSVESRGSAQTNSSSEAGSERPSPNVSRNASFQSTGGAPGSVNNAAISGNSSANKGTNNSNGNSKQSTSNRKKGEIQRTVTTLMGGRGYINWRRTAVEKNRTSALAQINNSDAFLVIWETKL